MSSTYYEILLSYEIPYNVLDTSDPSLIEAKTQLFERMKNIIPQTKYETFTLKLTIYQLKDTMNFIITYEALFRSTDGLPMEEYVEARALKDNAKKELENFFNSVDCDFRQLNIKTLL